MKSAASMMFASNCVWAFTTWKTLRALLRSRANNSFMRLRIFAGYMTNAFKNV